MSDHYDKIREDEAFRLEIAEGVGHRLRASETFNCSKC
jgi:nitrate/TMAO reductase-like tetraheme cytochrome c subunit